MPTQPPFPKDHWLTAAKYLFEALDVTSRWLKTYQPPPGPAVSGEMQVSIYPERASEDEESKDGVGRAR